MQGVSKQWNVDLSIGGKQYPANTSNIRQLFWFESIHQNLPSLSLELIDVDGTFSSIAAAGDGVPIDITLGDGGLSGETSATFNIQGSPSLSHESGYGVLKINAVLDSLPYMRSIASGLMEGTSSTVLSQLASRSGLSFQGDTTSDSMVWLPNNKTIAGFVRHVANHGWAGSGSCMVPVVTDQKELLYRNIMQAKPSGEVFGNGFGENPIVDWSAASNGAITNHNRGYGSTSIGFNEEGIVQEFNKITFNMVSNFLGLSVKNVGALGNVGGRVDSIIRSAGNTHQNYAQAAHQNQRLRAMFSTDLNILTERVSNSKILDTIFATPIDHTTLRPNPTYTGSYTISARTKVLTRSRYAERITATTQGGS